MTGQVRPRLELKALCLRQDQVNILSNIEIQLFPGEFHLVMGQNGAGKTSLLQILAGLREATSGTILWNGLPCKPNQNFATKCKIAYCGQELDLLPNMTVFDNFYVGSIETINLIFHRKALVNKLEQFLEQYQFRFDLSAIVSTLSCSEQFLLQFARCLFHDPSVILIDEISASLAAREISSILDILKNLCRKGISVVYTSHSIREALPFADRLSIIEDGMIKLTSFTASIDFKDYSSLFVEKNAFTNLPKLPAKLGKPLVETDHLSTERIRNVSFSLRQGEILGVFGLAGSGRSSFLRSIAKLDPIKEGTLRFFPDEKKIKIGYLPEVVSGFENLDLVKNVTISDLNRVMVLPYLISPTEETFAYNDLILRLGVHCQTKRPDFSKISRGNQQKILIARCLHSQCNLYLLDNPTRNVDSAGKIELYNIFSKLAQKMAGIIIVSSNLNELLGLCDKIMLFSDGQVIHTFDTAHADFDTICSYL